MAATHTPPPAAIHRQVSQKSNSKSAENYTNRRQVAKKKEIPRAFHSGVTKSHAPNIQIKHKHTNRLR